jgi:FdhD protein
MTISTSHSVDIDRWSRERLEHVADHVVIEEPLEIRVRAPEQSAYQTLSLTMRTPGHDIELAVGFLHGEGLISRREEILDARLAEAPGNEVQLTVAPSVDLRRLVASRRFYMTSSCGVCGRDSLEAVLRALKGRRVDGSARITPEVLTGLPAKLREHQAVFQTTGGLHGCGLFDTQGAWIDLREDVGRHNAVDKLVGRAFLDGRLPWTDRILLLSGRASFELIQKAVMAGVSAVAAVGAPSSLAVELARGAGQTLFGFVGANRFNTYSGPERLALDRPPG